LCVLSVVQQLNRMVLHRIHKGTPIIRLLLPWPSTNEVIFGKLRQQIMYCVTYHTDFTKTFDTFYVVQCHGTRVNVISLTYIRILQPFQHRFHKYSRMVNTIRSNILHLSSPNSCYKYIKYEQKLIYAQGMAFTKFTSRNSQPLSK
jgi:hypothetical protein